MILDLAHASERTFFEVLEHAPDAPVVVSHACCRAVYDTPRNLSDDQLRALRDHDGVLAVMAIPLAVDLEAPSLERVVDHIDHAVAVMGIEHVGIGADFMAQIVASGAEPACQAIEPHAATARRSPTPCPGSPGRRTIRRSCGPWRRAATPATSSTRSSSGNLLRLIAGALARGRRPVSAAAPRTASRDETLRLGGHVRSAADQPDQGGSHA